MLVFKKHSSSTVINTQTFGDSHHIKLYLLPQSNFQFKMVFGNTIISVRHFTLNRKWDSDGLYQWFCNYDLKQPHTPANDFVALGECKVRSLAETGRAFHY